MRKDMNKEIEMILNAKREESYETIDDIMKGLMDLEEEEELTGQELLEKEKVMRGMLKTYRMLQKYEEKLLKGMDELSSEYDELLKQAKDIEIEDYKPDFKLKELFEKAKEILRKRRRDNETDDLKKLVNISYDISAELNQIRYKARKTPEEITRQQELIETLEELRKRISELTDDMQGKEC